MNTHMIDYASICIYIHIQYMIVCSYMSILSVNIDAYRCICRERTRTWTIDTYDGQYLSIRFVNITNISKSGKISKHSTMAATMLATLCSSIPALGGSSVCSLVTCLPPVISSTSCCVFGNGWLNTWPCSSHKSLERFGRFNRHMCVTWWSLWPQNAKQICMDPSTGRQMDISCSSCIGAALDIYGTGPTCTLLSPMPRFFHVKRSVAAAVHIAPLHLLWLRQLPANLP